MALIIVRSETATSDTMVKDAGRYKVASVPLGNVKFGTDTDSVRGKIVSRSMAQSYKGPDGKTVPGKAASLAFIPIPKNTPTRQPLESLLRLKKGPTP